MKGVIVQSAKDRIAQAKHRSEVLLEVAHDLSERQIKAIESFLIKEGLLSVISRDRLYREMDRVYGQMAAELSQETAYEQYSALARRRKRRFQTPESAEPKETRQISKEEAKALLAQLFGASERPPKKKPSSSSQLRLGDSPSHASVHP